jgi:hypothetical protein
VCVLTWDYRYSNNYQVLEWVLEYVHVRVHAHVYLLRSAPPARDPLDVLNAERTPTVSPFMTDFANGVV